MGGGFFSYRRVSVYCLTHSPVLLFPGPPSPNSTPPQAQKEASPTPSSGGGGSSPFIQRKREAETLQEAITATALPGDPPLLPGELLCYIGKASFSRLNIKGSLTIII